MRSGAAVENLVQGEFKQRRLAKRWVGAGFITTIVILLLYRILAADIVREIGRCGATLNPLGTSAVALFGGWLRLTYTESIEAVGA